MFLQEKYLKKAEKKGKICKKHAKTLDEKQNFVV